MANKKQSPRSSDRKGSVYDPNLKRNVPTIDMRQEMREMSKETPQTKEDEQAFYSERIKILPGPQKKQLLRDIGDFLKEEKKTDRRKRVDRAEEFDEEEVLDSLSRASRRNILDDEEMDDSETGYYQRDLYDEEKILDSLSKASRRTILDDEWMLNSRGSPVIRSRLYDEKPPSPMPVPGGVGFGIIYKHQKLQFRNSTTLYHHIVIAPSVGSAENRWLYLTSTNRAPWCCEAFVSYRGQQGPRFMIYDWSKKAEHSWIVSIPIRKLKPYQVLCTVRSATYRTIYVMNETRWLGGMTWMNRVFLRNRVTETFDMMHQNEYILPPDHERSYLWWGPIVETFHPHPNVINEVGFLDILLLQDELERKLTPDVVRFSTEKGFDPVYLGKNFSFIVH